MNKSELRKKAKAIRVGLDMESVSISLNAALRKKSFYKKAKNVMIYYPMKGEVNLLPLLDDDKSFYLPRVAEGRLEVCRFFAGDELEVSNVGICEPCAESVDAKSLDLVIVPALMADKKGHRLGYGKGFYDRFLKKTKAVSVVLVPKELMIEELPAEDHDVRIDEVIYV